MQRNDCVVEGLGPSFLTYMGRLLTDFERLGDVTYDGVTYGPNQPISTGAKYVHHGAFTNIIPYSEQFSDLSLTNTDVLDNVIESPFGDMTADKIISTISNSNHSISYTAPVIINNRYTKSIYLKADEHEWAQLTFGTGGFGTDAWANFHLSGAGSIGNTGTGISIDDVSIESLSGGWYICHITATVLSSTTSSVFVLVGTNNVDAPSRLPAFSGDDTSGFYAWGCMAIELAYNIYPIYIPTSGTSASIVTAASNALDTHGATWDLTAPENAKWLDLLTGTGTMSISNLNIVPAKTEWQTVGVLNILAGETGNNIIYVDTDGFIKATDGTNTTVSNQEYVAGQDHKVELTFNGVNMKIIVDDIDGTTVAFVGTFTPGDTLKLNLGNEDILSWTDLSGSLTGFDSGDYNDLLHDYYLANGATSGNLQNAEYEFLIAQGATALAIPDMWYEVLGTLGYTGTLSDRMTDFWCIGGGSLV